MNYFVFKKISFFEEANNNTEKAIKINHAIEFVIMYYSVVFCCHTKEKKLASKEITEIILTNFYKRNPLTSYWLKLLSNSVALLKLKIDFQDVFLNRQIQMITKYFLPDESKKEIKDNLTIKDLCDCVSIIRNKGFAHANSISEECLTFLMEHSFDRIPYYLAESFEKFDSSRLYLAENICSYLDDGQEYSSSFCDLSNNLIKKITISNAEAIDFENIYSKNLYCYFHQTNAFINLAPFFIYRDEQYFFYSGVDNKSQPIFSSIFSNKNIVVKKYQESFKEIVKDDIDLINSSTINIKLKLENGIYNNLPTPSFEKFIGRSESIAKTLTAINNRRIFLIAISVVRHFKFL